MLVKRCLGQILIVGLEILRDLAVIESKNVYRLDNSSTKIIQSGIGLRALKR